MNTELKQLYTAITRARVHVWIFDENEDDRAPMFEYFKARKLVQSVKEGETGGMCQYAENFDSVISEALESICLIIDGNNKLLVSTVFYEGCLEIIETFSLTPLGKRKPLELHQKVNQDTIYLGENFPVYDIIRSYLIN